MCGSFHDCVTLDDWWVMNCKWFGRKSWPIRGTTPESAWRGWEKPQTTSVTIARLPVEIWNENLSKCESRGLPLSQPARHQTMLYVCTGERDATHFPVWLKWNAQLCKFVLNVVRIQFSVKCEMMTFTFIVFSKELNAEVFGVSNWKEQPNSSHNPPPPPGLPPTARQDGRRDGVSCHSAGRAVSRNTLNMQIIAFWHVPPYSLADHKNFTEMGLAQR
jgi:hypothetical protein